jgi:hypothetical protein
MRPAALCGSVRNPAFPLSIGSMLLAASIACFIARRGSPVPSSSRCWIVARAYAEEWVWSNLTVRRLLRLAKLRDEGLHWRGTDAAISASDNYAAPASLGTRAPRCISGH